jgi:hypothetical protein
MKKTFVFKQCKFILSRLCLLLLIGVVSSCQQDEEIISLEEENMEVDLLADTTQYKTYHEITGKGSSRWNGEVIGRLNNKLEAVNEAGDVIPKTSDWYGDLAVVFYQHDNFNGTKQAKYHYGSDLYLANSSFPSSLRTGITGVYVAPGCTLRLYAQDYGGSLIRTIYAGSNGYSVHDLGSQNDDTRSAIVSCNSLAENRFLGFIHEHANYVGRSIPLFSRSSSYIPSDISGFNVGISSVSMNRHHDYNGVNRERGVVISDDNNDSSLPILAHNDVDVPFLGRLNDRRLRFEPKTVAKKSDTDIFINSYRTDNAGPKKSVTSVELNALCQPRFDACANSNGNYEFRSAVGVAACTAGFALLKSTVASIGTNTITTNTLTATITTLNISNVASVLALKAAMQGFIAANPFSVILALAAATAGSVGCFYILKAAANIANLPDCGNVKENCVSGRYGDTVTCSNCIPGGDI